MSNDAAWDLDFGGTTTEAVDLDNSAIPDGWYRGKLIGVKDDNENGAKILEFQIIHGTLTGRKVREWLNNPKFQNSPGGIEFAKKKANCFAKRLGLVDSAADGKTVQRSYSAAIGKEMLFKLTTKKGEKKDFQGMDFDCYPPGHPSVKADVYAHVGLVAPPEAPKGTASETSKATKQDVVPATPAKSPEEMAKMVW